MTSGFQPADLIIIAGRPSMGKTAMALQIAAHVAQYRRVAAGVFSMEMSKEQLALRLISSLSEIDHQDFRRGRLDDNAWNKILDAITKLADLPILIDDTSALTPTELRSRARQMKLQHDIGVMVVDYLQLMDVVGSLENRATMIAEITRSLKGLAKELNIPLIALSQLNRSLEKRSDKRPVMADLRESGAIEQDADTIIFIYRDDYYNLETPEPGVAEIIIGKQRNGPTGVVKLAFEKHLTRFSELPRATPV
jgi:replicative DNA helicase